MPLQCKSEIVATLAAGASITHPNAANNVGCIHTVWGYDLNYGS